MSNDTTSLTSEERRIVVGVEGSPSACPSAGVRRKPSRQYRIDLADRHRLHRTPGIRTIHAGCSRPRWCRIRSECGNRRGTQVVSRSRDKGRDRPRRDWSRAVRRERGSIGARGGSGDRRLSGASALVVGDPGTRADRGRPPRFSLGIRGPSRATARPPLSAESIVPRPPPCSPTATRITVGQRALLGVYHHLRPRPRQLSHQWLPAEKIHVRGSTAPRIYPHVVPSRRQQLPQIQARRPWCRGPSSLGGPGRSFEDG